MALCKRVPVVSCRTMSLFTRSWCFSGCLLCVLHEPCCSVLDPFYSVQLSAEALFACCGQCLVPAWDGDTVLTKCTPICLQNETCCHCCKDQGCVGGMCSFNKVCLGFWRPYPCHHGSVQGPTEHTGRETRYWQDLCWSSGRGDLQCRDGGECDWEGQIPKAQEKWGRWFLQVAVSLCWGAGEWDGAWQLLCS